MQMRLAGSSRCWLIIILLAGITGLALFFARRPSTPFYVGSPVEEIWDYIHTDAASDVFPVGIVPITKSTRWIADISTVKAETTFTWKKTALAVRTTVYSYDNGVVTAVHSKWKLQWRF